MKFEYDFSNFHISRRDLKTLKEISKTPMKYTHKYDDLVSCNLVTFEKFIEDDIANDLPDKTSDCIITNKGSCYLRYRRNRFIESKLPIVISVLALLIALASLLIDFFQLLNTL